MGPKLEITSGTGLEPNLRLGTGWKQPAGSFRGFGGSLAQGQGIFCHLCAPTSYSKWHSKWKRAVLRANTSPSLSLHDLNLLPSPSASGAVPQLKSLLPVTAPVLWEVKGGGGVSPHPVHQNNRNGH